MKDRTAENRGQESGIILIYVDEGTGNIYNEGTGTIYKEPSILKRACQIFRGRNISDREGALDSEEGMSDISGAKTPFNRGEIIHEDKPAFSGPQFEFQ